MPSVADALRFARDLGVDPRDAELLLAHRSRRDRTALLTHPEAEVPVRTAHAVTRDLLKRRAGVPLAYLIGSREFFGLRFIVSPAVLIPRPETEVLVEEALRRIPPRSPFRVADIGTGSGCIAVALARHRPHLRIEAVDSSPRALTVARRNATAHRVGGRIRFHRGNLVIPLRRTPLDGIVANLPYLPSGPLPPGEPRAALSGGPDGLRHFRTLFRQLEHRADPPRFVLLEIDPRILLGLRRLVPERYRTSVVQDLAGRNRVVVCVPRT